jgi:hypothetical protein
VKISSSCWSEGNLTAPCLIRADDYTNDNKNEAASYAEINYTSDGRNRLCQTARSAIHRRLGPWLIGLYVLAIVGGFIPFVVSYSAHSGAHSAISEIDGRSGPQQRHHLGDADDTTNHHVVQDLTGTVAWLPDSNVELVKRILLRPAAPRPFIEADAVRLDRPPKSRLSI